MTGKGSEYGDHGLFGKDIFPEILWHMSKTTTNL